MSDWVETPLGKAFKVKHGFAFSGEFFTDEPQPFVLVTPGNFSLGGGFQSLKQKYYKGPIPYDYILQPGSVIVTMTDLSKQSDTLGLAAVVPDDGTTWLHNQRVGLLEFYNLDESDPVFFSYLLRTHDYRSWIVGSATGTTVKHTAPRRIESYRCSIPKIHEQRRIGSVLKSFDDKIALNRQINQTLEAMSQALFQSWFVDFDPVKAKVAARREGRDPLRAAMTAVSGKADADLDALPTEDYDRLAATAALFPDEMQVSELGEIPGGWEVKTVESVARKVAMGPFGSNIKVETFADQGIPIISGQHLKDTLLEESEFNYITNDHAAKLGNSIVSRGDVIFTHAGSIGQVSLIPEGSKFENYIISQRQFYMRPDLEKMKPSYIVYFFRSPNGQHLLLANASQVGVPSISRPSSYLKSIRIPVPTIGVLTCFDKIVGCYFQRIVSLRNQIVSLSILRDGLLPKLLSGELSVSNISEPEGTI